MQRIAATRPGPPTPHSVLDGDVIAVVDTTTIDRLAAAARRTAAGGAVGLAVDLAATVAAYRIDGHWATMSTAGAVAAVLLLTAATAGACASYALTRPAGGTR